MKEFNLEEALEKKNVCTKCGCDVRILCHNRKGKYPIVALVDNGDEEELCDYTFDGKFFDDLYNDLDLMLKDDEV